MNTNLEVIRELAERRRQEDSLISQLPALEAEQRRQAEIEKAQVAAEVLSVQFSNQIDTFIADKSRLDSELRAALQGLEVLIQARLELAKQANEVYQLASHMAGAKVRSRHPDGSEDWQIEGLGHQLIMDKNGGLKQLMVLPNTPDDTPLMDGLLSAIGTQTGEGKRNLTDSYYRRH